MTIVDGKQDTEGEKGRESMRAAKHVTAVYGKQDTEREKERESMRAAKQEWQQRQMEAFRNRRQVEGERAEPAPLPFPLDSPPVYAPGKCTACIVTEHTLPALQCVCNMKGVVADRRAGLSWCCFAFKAHTLLFLTSPGVEYMTLHWVQAWQVSTDSGNDPLMQSLQQLFAENHKLILSNKMRSQPWS